MNVDSFERTLRSFQRAKQFKSYLVVFEDGETIKIDHPEALVTRSRTAFYIEPDDNFMLFDADSVSRLTYPAQEKVAS